MVSDVSRIEFAKSVVAVLAQPAAVLSARGHVVACNSVFHAAFDDSRFYAAEWTLTQALRPEDRSQLDTYFSRTTAQHDTFLAKIALASGQFNLTLDMLDGPEGEALHLCQLTADVGIDSTRLRFLLEHLDQGVWNYNVLSQTFSVTDAWRRMRRLPEGYDLNDLTQAGEEWLEPIHPDDRGEVRRLFLGQVSGDADVVNVQYRYRRGPDDWVWILSRASVMTHDQFGKPVQIVGMDIDITEIKNNEAAHQELADKMQLAVDVAGVGVWHFDTENAKVYWDDRVLEIYGITDGQNERSDREWSSFLHPDDRDVAVQQCESIEGRRNFKMDYRIVRASGDVRYVRSVARMLNSTETKLVGVNIDVTEDYQRTEELEAARKLLEHDASHDALTGLANRRLLDDACHAMMQRLSPADRFAVLHIDLDHFKQVNDGLGHAAGDAVLVHVASVLQTHVGDAGLVCRIGGDEFVVLLERVVSTQKVRELCGALVEEMRAPITVAGQRCTVGLSIGCALGQGGAEDASEVFLNADVALYAAKSDGRSCFKVFADGMRPVSRVEATAHHNLRAAMEDGQLICAFQPQFDAKTMQMVGAEALVRWQCPDRGTVGPFDFLPLAKKTGLVPRVDEYVLDYVLQMQTNWARAGLEVPLIALNICLERLMEPSFLTQIRDKVQPHHSVAFELLETAFLDDCDAPVLMVLDTLREAGIRIDLDDFGSGHSSVVALQAVRPDRVKMDRLLVAPLTTTPAQVHILKALSEVARLQGCGVVIEGVETQVQLDALADVECEALQGFMLGRPVTAEEFAKRLTPLRQTVAT